MGGPDTIKGISYQNAYTLYRLIELLDPDSSLQSLAVEGKGSDVEDLTLTYKDGWETAIQVKKRETKEGQFGLWGLSDMRSIIGALYSLSDTGRKIKAYRFVATGSAHPRLIDIQKACQRLRDDSFTTQKDGRAVSDVQAMTGASEKKTLDFMERLWLEVPLESETFFEKAVQNWLITSFGISASNAESAYNDLYKRLLDMGKQADPQARIVDFATLTTWLEQPQEKSLADAYLIKVRQRLKILRGEMIGVEIEGDTQESVDVEQEVDEVSEAAKLVGYRRRQNRPDPNS